MKIFFAGLMTLLFGVACGVKKPPTPIYSMTPFAESTPEPTPEPTPRAKSKPKSR